LIHKKTINETSESRKQFEKELEEFRKITESLIKGAERLGLIDKEKIKDLSKRRRSLITLKQIRDQ